MSDHQDISSDISPSILKEESDKFDFLVHLGYDHGDSMLDGDRGPFERTFRNAASQIPIDVVYQRVPKSGWLSFIRNVLFTAAMREGCYYFTKSTMTFPSRVSAG